jgi:1-acyl-sn-glycerol-3-phosphate acyltransferase
MSNRANRDYSRAGRAFTKVVLPSVIRGVMKRDWRGREHIPREGGLIIAPNHLSYADWAAVALFLHQAGRYPDFLIKAPVFDIKVLGPFLRSVGQLPVRRGEVDAALVLKDAEEALRRGECLVVYPEGTASRDPALWPMAGKTGAARLALTTGCPVIPIAMWGAQDILPYGTSKPHLLPRHTVHLRAGPPVDLSAFAEQPMTREILRDATSAIMADITSLLAGIRGQTPPETRYDPAAARRAARTAPADAEPPAAPEAGPEPPTAGAEPPTAGAEPPTAGAEPPTAGAEPPAAGLAAPGDDEAREEPVGEEPGKAMPA